VEQQSGQRLNSDRQPGSSNCGEGTILTALLTGLCMFNRERESSGGEGPASGAERGCFAPVPGQRRPNREHGQTRQGVGNSWCGGG